MTKIQTPVRQIKLSDNVHPNCNGSPWGWLVFKDSPRTRVATYSGYEEKARCRELADALNRTADLEAKLATATKALDDAREVLAGWLTGVEYDESLKAYDIIDKALTAISGDTKGDDDGK